MSYAKAFAAAVIILAAGLGAWRLFIYESGVDKGTAALRSAYRTGRPVEARLTGFEYAPAVILRGDDRVNVDQIARNRAERILLDEVIENPGPASQHALGQFYLSERKFDDAIPLFEEALKADPQNARVHSDLGAALLERGKLERSGDEPGKSINEFARSLEHLNKAIEFDGAMLEPPFNRALLYQELMLLSQAEEDWRKYLEKDPNSPWAEEGLRRLRSVEEQKKNSSKSREETLQDFISAYQAGDDETAWQIVSRNHGRAGNVVVEQLLDAYLDLAEKGQGGAADLKLLMLSYVGKAGIQKSNDHFYSDLARFYAQTTPERRAILAEARGLMKSGHEGWGQRKTDETMACFIKAKKMFEQAGNFCESKLAEYWVGLCHNRAHREGQSLSILKELTRTCEEKKYKWFLARCLRESSAVQFNFNEHSKAIEQASQSLKVAEQAGDLTGMLNALGSLIEYYRHLAGYNQSLSYIERSLSLVTSASLDPNQRCRHYGILALTFTSLGLYAAAAEYQKEALNIALSIGNVTTVSVSYGLLGLIYGRMQNYGEALKNAQAAIDVIKLNSNEPAGQDLIAYSSLQLGHIYRQSGDLDNAIASYDRSIELYNKLSFPTHLYQAHKGRLLCYLAQKDNQLIKEEIQTALSLVEGYRTRIFEGDNRNNFFDLEQSVYNLAIDFEYSIMNDPLRAFEYSESSRARSLLDMINTDARMAVKDREPDIIFRSVSRPLPVAEIQRRMPEQAQILQYAVLEDKLLIWVISATQISTRVEKISQSDLSQKVIDYLQAVSSPSESKSEEARRRSEELFDILIGPVESLLDAEKQICVIPDGVLNYFPFGALVSPASGRYLIEDYLLVFSPSSTVFIVCSEMAGKKAGPRDERLLGVGNPLFDHKAFPSLPDLPSAGREVREVAAYYNSPRTLTGGGARVRPVKDAMEKSDVIHLALHSVLDKQSPMRSKLLLAKDPAEGGDQSASTGVLPAYDIYDLNLQRTRLVVLSACQTGAERYYKGEGMISLARTFIARGVPLVAASLWPVETDSTSELMIRFHKHRKRDSVSSAEALRRAQLEMLAYPERRFREPYCWASFIVIGGAASF